MCSVRYTYAEWTYSFMVLQEKKMADFVLKGKNFDVTRERKHFTEIP